MTDEQPLTPAQRTMRARVASHTSWSQTADRAARTAPARRNSPNCLDYHLDRVDPAITDPDARLAMAKSAHSARMSSLALASSRARAARKNQQNNA